MLEPGHTSEDERGTCPLHALICLQFLRLSTRVVYVRIVVLSL